MINDITAKAFVKAQFWLRKYIKKMIFDNGTRLNWLFLCAHNSVFDLEKKRLRII